MNDADLSAEKGQKDADKPQCKAAKKVWPWLVAALLVAVVLLVVLLVVRNSRKGGEELSLAEAVALVNAKTPAVGATMVLDSVTSAPRKTESLTTTASWTAARAFSS